MKIRTSLSVFVLILAQCIVSAQQSPYSISKTAFSTDSYDEFAPVFFRNGLVFCSDRGQAVNSEGRAVVKLLYVDTTGSGKKARMLSKSLKSKLNDGPATFNRTGDTIYFSRNLVVEGNLRLLSTYRNKLGLFYAVAGEKGWDNIRELRFNTEWFNITMPTLSHDGQRLYFASDKPDGLGGLDLYYSNWRNGYWEDPVNLGPEINTEGNETYPFISQTGELFFSSDGRGGLGGKDIYVTKEKDDGWHTPVRLSAPVNSEYDDFGIVTTADVREGYFSSDRDKSVDIYYFKSEMPQVWFAEEQKENLYCFSVSDTGKIVVDTLSMQYVWNFGDNTKMTGTRVHHCFPGPGKYAIALDIIDRATGKTFFRKQTWDIEIVDYEQPFISGPDCAVAGEAVDFDGMKSYLPGYSVTGFFWDFGDGAQMTGAGPTHTFERAGEYNVRLGVTIRSNTTGDVLKRAVTRKIRVFGSRSDKDSWLAARSSAVAAPVDLRQYENVLIRGQYSAEAEFMKEAVFQVEILSSKTRLELTNPLFRGVPVKYNVKEVYNPENGTYSYVIDQQMSLMATFPAYREIIPAGFRDATVRLHVLTDPAERELNVLKRNYGVLTDTYFDARNRLVTNAYLMLDQVVMLMNKYPSMNLEIGVHTDNQGTAYNLERLSQTRAQVIVNYLINRGIASGRLTPRGYGSTRPVASNAGWLDRRLNRRVEFTIVK
jgi:hypothetical protein